MSSVCSVVAVLVAVGALSAFRRYQASGPADSATGATELRSSELSATGLPRSSEHEPCPADMVLVHGLYCPSVELRCLRWLDSPSVPYARCATYAEPARCRTERVPLRFCIDRYEYTAPGERLPLNYASFTKAVALCSSLQRRVCTEDEWNFACEGEELRPYPYGFSREPVCNQDRRDLYEHTASGRSLRDLREPSSSRPRCVSPFGVYDMVGNLDEPVRRAASAQGFSGALKGGWWMPARNRCRPSTTAHGDFYQGIQVGVRCCGDAE